MFLGRGLAPSVTNAHHRPTASVQARELGWTEPNDAGRMGHAKMSTTERYLGTLPDVDETALDALTKIRNRSRQQVTSRVERLIAI
jgi:hypothetical protein